MSSFTGKTVYLRLTMIHYRHSHFFIIMKKYFIIGAIITALIAVITIINLLYNRPQKTLPAVVNTAAVTPLSSQVFSSLPLEEITTPTNVPTGKRIITSATGRALIEATHTTVIDANTEITLTTLDPTANQTEIELHAGNLWSRVKKISDQGEYFDIVTDNARASVRGTSFGVMKKGRITILTVTEGTVLFGPKNGPQIVVPAGKKSFVMDDNTAIIAEITDEDTQDPWFIFNNPDFIRNTTTSAESDATAPALPSPDEPVQPDTPATSDKNNDAVVNTPPPVSNTTEPAQPTATNEPSAQTAPPSSAASPSQPAATEPVPTPSAALTGVFPNTATYGDTRTITLTGKNFITANVTTISLGTFTVPAFTKISDTRIEFTLNTRQIGVGSFSVSITDANKSRSTLMSAFSVTEATTTANTSIRAR